jgi:hypothetical protein
MSVISSSKEEINPYKCGSLSISKLGEKHGPSLFKRYTTKNNAVDPLTFFIPSSIYLRLNKYQTKKVQSNLNNDFQLEKY